MNNVDGWVFAAAAEGGEGKHGDAGWGGKEFLRRGVGLFDDFRELSGSRVFAGGHIGKEVEFGVTTHDDEAGEGIVGF